MTVSGPLRGADAVRCGDVSSQYITASCDSGPTSPAGCTSGFDPSVSASYLDITASVMSSFGASDLTSPAARARQARKLRADGVHSGARRLVGELSARGRGDGRRCGVRAWARRFVRPRRCPLRRRAGLDGLHRVEGRRHGGDAPARQPAAGDRDRHVRHVRSGPDARGGRHTGRTRHGSRCRFIREKESDRPATWRRSSTRQVPTCWWRPTAGSSARPTCSTARASRHTTTTDWRWHWVARPRGRRHRGRRSGVVSKIGRRSGRCSNRSRPAEHDASMQEHDSGRAFDLADGDRS